MSDEVGSNSETSGPKTTSKRRKSLNPRKAKPALRETKAANTVAARQATGHRGWTSGRAFKCVIHGNPNEMGQEVPFQLGDSTKITVLRGKEVVLPWEVKSILDDTIVDMPKTEWKNGKPVRQYTEKFTRYPYVFMGEVPWEEYEAFRAEQMQLPLGCELE